LDKEYSRQFFNGKATHWDETPRSNAAHQLEAMIARLDLIEGSRVLDVGTGTGIFVPYIKRNIGPSGHVVCVDFALEMLLIANEKSISETIMPVCAEIETVGFRPMIFDAVVCYSTFPHFHDKPQALRNMYAHLKNDGKVFVCHTASREHINQIHRNIPDFQDHLIPQNDKMMALMQEAGYEDVRIEECEDSYLVVGQK